MSTESMLRTSRIEEAATVIDPVFLSTPLVCASAGNFGQGIAHAARSRGIGTTVFAALNANPLKVEAMRAFGAEVRLEGHDFDAAKAEVHAPLYELAGAGIAILAISSELPEILTISDRIVTMREGRVTGEVMRTEASEERLMQLMALGQREAA